MFSNRTLVLSLFICLMLSVTAFGQQVAPGTPAFGSLGGGPFDTLNLGNLNDHLDFSFMNKTGRGLPFRYGATYDSAIWYPTGVIGSQTWVPVSNWGWKGQTGGLTGYITYSVTQHQCLIDPGPPRVYDYEEKDTSWRYIDTYGVTHFFAGTVTDGNCGDQTSLVVTTGDGSGYTLSAYVGGATITDRSGNIIAAPLQTSNGNGSITED